MRNPWTIAFSALVLATGPAIAAPPTSITIDGSLGHGSGSIAPSSPGFYNIPASVGKTVGPNLFQSFGTFDLGTGDTASFQSGGASNIIARVTGGSVSSIDGTLQSQANLFLINAAGVMFGANAALDVSGAFTVATANYVKFSDGGIFHAQLGANDNLTSAPVSAFGFLTAHPAPVQFQDALLGVQPTMSLNIFAGDITVDDTYLIASSGNINLFSAANAGEVPFSLASPGNGFSSATNTSFGNVTVRNGSLLAIDGPGGGRVVIRGGHLTVDNSQVRSKNTGSAAGGGILLQANQLTVQNSALIFTSASGAGAAGDITAQADTVTVDGTGAPEGFETGLFSVANASGAGTISVAATGDVHLVNGGQISTTTSGPGGAIDLEAHALTIDDSSGSDQSTGIFASDFSNGAGTDSAIDVRLTDLLTILNGGSIEGLGFAAANGPNIWVTARAVTIDGGTSAFFTGIESDADGTGRVGPINVELNEGLTLMNGGEISSTTFSSASYGSIYVVAGSVAITGSPVSAFDTGILTFADDAGRASDIAINAGGAINIGPLGKISSITFGSGSSGDIDIFGSSTLTNTGGTIGTSSLASNGVLNLGTAGSVNVTTEGALTLLNGGLIDSGTDSAGNAGAVTVGSYSLTIDGTGAGSLFTGIADQTTTGATGNAGNVWVSTYALSILNSGNISSNTFSSGTGGNVTVRATSLTIDGDNNAVSPTGISANTNTTATGNGGSVDVLVDGPATVTNRGQISITTFTPGNAGTLTLDVSGALAITDGGEVSGGAHAGGASGAVSVQAGSLLITDAGHNAAQTGISNQSNTGATGSSGPLNISVDGALVIQAGGEISSGTRSTGNGGDVTVQAGSLTIGDGVGVPHLTGITSETDGTLDGQGNPTGIGGDAGSVVVDVTGALVITSGRIDTDTFCFGNAGNVTVHAGSIDIDADPGALAVGIFSNSNGFAGDTTGRGGNAGSVDVTVDGTLALANHGGIGAATFTSGRGGNVDINTANFSATGALTGVTAQASGSGDGGSINVEANDVALADDAIITASARNSNGGTITITAGSKVTLTNGGVISTQAEVNGGDITLHVGNLVYLSYSKIIAAAGNNGGNVLIDPQFVVLDHSLISANAALGQGGNITIITDNFLNNLTLITATGATDGSINITAPVLDLSGALVPLSGVIENDENRLRESCAASINHEFSSFILVGRGGAESSPNELQPDFGLDALPSSPTGSVQ